MIVFGRLYTVVMCDIIGRLLGFDAVAYTWIHDIPTYLWVELIVYGPVMWFALYQVTTDVFGDIPSDPSELRRHRRRQFVATAAGAAYLYGVGVHVADTIEVFSREHEGITEGRAYELVYFIDEGVSHYIQFVSLFFVIGWFVIFDRAGRTAHASLALFLGAAHGVERGLGTIEGEKWYAVPVLVLWVAGAARLRHRRVGRDAFGEFFFRYALVFVAMVPVSQIAYGLWFGGFEPASAFDDAEYVQLALGAAALTLAGTVAAHAADRWTRVHAGSDRADAHR